MTATSFRTLLVLVNLLTVLAFFDDKVLTETNETLVLNITDVLPDDDGSLRSMSFRKFIINGTTYETELVGEFATGPPLMMEVGDDGVARQTDGNGDVFRYEFYHGVDSPVAFTLITHLDRYGIVGKQVRGNIFDGELQIVIEPHMDELAQAKRQNRTKRETQSNAVYPSTVKVEYQKRLLSDDFLDPKTKGAFVSSMPFTQFVSGRGKRQAKSKLETYIKILAVVDYTLYQRALKSFERHGVELVGTYLEAYMCQIINIANLYYKRSLKNNPNLGITLVPQAFLILTTPEASSFTTSPNVLTLVNQVNQDSSKRDYVDGDSCIHEFNRWLVNYKYADNVKPTINVAYDVAIAFVGVNLFGAGDLLGIANTNSVCNSGSNGIIVEDIEGFFSAQTIAHEIGHALGLPHDADYKNSNCLDQANYVMSSSVKSANLNNSFYFSDCSINSLVTNIITNGKFQCIRTKAVPDADVVRFSNFAPGQLTNLTEQCVIVFGPGHFPLTGPKSYVNGVLTYFEDDICTSFWCTPDGSSGMSKQPAAEQTSCGNGKWCQEGKCVSHPDAPKGDCLIADHTDYCESVTKAKTKPYTCANYNTGICCKYCNPSAKVVQQSHSYKVWLAENKIPNLQFIDKEPAMKCPDDLWCETGLSAYLQRTPDACTSLRAYFNGRRVKDMCKTHCNTCK